MTTSNQYVSGVGGDLQGYRSPYPVSRMDPQMSVLIYNTAAEYEFDNRALAHIQIVIGAKLRRNESFYFSWDIPPARGSGRVTIWIHPAIPLSYRYGGSRPPVINRLWIEALMASANSASGLFLIPEPSVSAEH
jgi:hypothetical protein